MKAITGQCPITDAMWNATTPAIYSTWQWADDGNVFTLHIAFNTDNITLSVSEATRLRDVLNDFIRSCPANG